MGLVIFINGVAFLTDTSAEIQKHYMEALTLTILICDWIIASQQEGSNYSWRIPINLNLWQGVDGINNPCPKGFRLPTQAEFDEEKGSWGSNNQNTGGAWNNTPLKLPAAGRRGGRSSGEGAGNIAEGNSTLYWVSGSGTSPAIRVFQLTGTNANFSPSASDVGACVRCIKDY